MVAHQFGRRPQVAHLPPVLGGWCAQGGRKAAAHTVVFQGEVGGKVGIGDSFSHQAQTVSMYLLRLRKLPASAPRARHARWRRSDCRRPADCRACRARRMWLTPSAKSAVGQQFEIGRLLLAVVHGRETVHAGERLRRDDRLGSQRTRRKPRSGQRSRKTAALRSRGCQPRHTLPGGRSAIRGTAPVTTPPIHGRFP